MMILATLALGVLSGRTGLSLIGLTLLLWFLGEWLVFTWRARLTLRGAYLTRELRDERGVVDTLWAGRTNLVRASLHLRSRLQLPYVRVHDRLPFGVKLVTGLPYGDGVLKPGEALTLEYYLRSAGTGQLRFEGLRVELTDLQGFFYHAAFIHSPLLFRVLPSLAAADRRSTTLKRSNQVIGHGLHRFRGPGGGSELLDLRDYRPGDPPKTIAWKVSARRDRLVTKEFESEVPIRCTLFVDTSHAVRLGPPGQNALAHLVELAAIVAQADAAAHDWTGLCLFDETRVTTYVRPARGTRHLLHLLNLLAEAAGSAPATGEARLDSLLPLAYAFAEEVYPDQLRPEVNSFPRWHAWFFPKPAWTSRLPTFGDRVYGSFPVLVRNGILASTAFFLFSSTEWATQLIDQYGLLPYWVLLGGVGVCWLLVLLHLLLTTLAFPGRRRQAARRKRLAALLSVHYGMAPGGVGTLLEDDRRFGDCVQRFLAEHYVPYPLPLYDQRGRYLFGAPGKVDVLARALLNAVGKGHDNELFVLLVDLLEMPDSLEPFLRAVKVALARHHQVMIICPWPPEIELPEARRGPAAAVAAHPPRAAAKQAKPAERRLAEVLLQATTARLHQAFFQLRGTLARLGVNVLCARGGDPARLVLDRINQLRAAGRKR